MRGSRVPAGKTIMLTLSMLLALKASAYDGDTTYVTLSARDVPLQVVLNEIQKQTGYYFSYCEHNLINTRNITIGVHDVSLDSALAICFRDQPLTYLIIGKIIIVKPEDQEEEPKMPLINAEQLNSMFVRGDTVFLALLAMNLNKHADRFGINNMVRLAHFLSQAGHETGGFSKKGCVEDLYYTTGQRIRDIFYRFRCMPDSIVRQYVCNPVKLANKAYAGRNGNGNEASGDGFKFHGRGIFQLTGRSNYAEFTDYYRKNFNCKVDFVCDPDQVANNTEYAILSALWYFQKHTSHLHLDETDESVEIVTKIICGSKTGLKERKEIFRRVYNALVHSCNSITQ